MTAKLSIALDVMGGDNGPRVVCNAALQELQHNPQLHLILVGNEEVIRPLVDDHARQFGERLIIHHTSQVVAMDEQPTLALRNKKDSSMRVAVNLVNDGQADACVSAGNTGALVATAHYVLKTLPGISRPALIKCLPAIDGRTWVLDLGANIDCSAHQLFQFSVMGSVISEAVGGIQHPRIGLLNMAWEGLENSKKYIEAAQLLFSSELNYIGYIDGGQIYSSDVDVVVSDGFVNNVALKTSEGAAKPGN